MSVSALPRNARLEPSTAYRPDVDGLRAVAVLAVVAYHAFPSLAPGGFVGVDVFFVISGYLISGIILDSLEKGTFTFREFYARRIRRIFPALLVILSACWIWGWFAVYSDDYALLGRHIAAGAGFASNFAFWSEAGYFDSAAETKPLLHLWSLGIEEQFYLVWPWLLVAAWKRRWNLLLLIAGIGTTSFLVNAQTTRVDPVAAFYSPLTRVWELMMGCALAWLMLRPSTDRSFAWATRWLAALRTTWPNATCGAGLVFVLASVFLFSDRTSFPGWRAALPTAGAFLVLAAGPGGWANRRLLACRLMVGIGLVSYPWYLWHWPMLSFARVAAAGPPTASVRAIVVLASVLLACLTYLAIEKPIRFGRRSPATVIGLSSLMTFVLIVGYVTYRAEGFVERPINTSDVAHFLQYYDRLHKNGLREAYRSECDFMDWQTEQVRPFISDDCTVPGTAATVFLWGDSYAQALSLGVREALPAGARLAQVTTSACPPRLTEEEPEALGGRCATANGYARARISAIKPALVILAQKGGHLETDWSELAEAIREWGGQEVVVVGPAPDWRPSLPVVVADRYWGQPHERVREGAVPGLLDADRQLSERLGGSAHLHYVSLLSALCNQDGCLATVPGPDQHLIAVDAAHFSPRGSVFVVDRTLRPYLAALPRQ